MPDTKRPIATYEGRDARERAEAEALELQDMARSWGYELEARVVKDRAHKYGGRYVRDVTWGLFVKPGSEQQSNHKRPHPRAS